MLNDYKHTIDSAERPDYDTIFETIPVGEATVVPDLSGNETEFPIPDAALTRHDRGDLPTRTVTSQVTSLPTPGQARSDTTSPTPSLRNLLPAVPPPKKSDLAVEDYAAGRKLVWCLWASGSENYDQFSRLTRDDCNWRKRFTDLAEQHNYPIRRWLASGIDVSQDISQVVMGLYEERQSHSDITITAAPADSALTCRTAFAAFHARGILNWQTHAAYGFHLATLRVQGKDDEATRLRQRLVRDMSNASGGPSFLLGFKYILEECGAYLGSDAKKLVFWKEKYFREYFKHLPRVRRADKLAIGLLSNVCYLRWIKVQGSCQADREAEILRITGFPVATAFQWALRLLLHLSSSGTKNPSYTMSLEPTDLCYRILRGLNCIWQCVDFFPRRQSDRLEPLISDSNVQDNWKKEILARIWVEWLGEDEDWFLPTTETPAAGLSFLSKVRNGYETEIVDEDFLISVPSQPLAIPDKAPKMGLQENPMAVDEDEAMLWNDNASVVSIAMEDQNFLQELKKSDYIDMRCNILWNGLTEHPISSDPWALNPDFDAFQVSSEPSAQQEQSSLEEYIGIIPKLAVSQERWGIALAPESRRNATGHSSNNFEISARNCPEQAAFRWRVCVLFL